MQVKTIESVYSESFYTTELNRNKYAIISDKAKIIRDFKNSVSLSVHKDLNTYKEFSAKDLVSAFDDHVDGLVGQDVQNAIVDVHTCYANKFEQIIKKCSMRVFDMEMVYYKKNGKTLLSGKREYNKGDFKEFKFTERITPLTKVLSYIAKYGNEETLDYFKKTLAKLNPDTKDKKELDRFNFYKSFVDYSERYTYERLLKIGLLRRSVLFNKYNEKPIEFTSLTYRTTSRIKEDVLSYNKNKKSVIKAFITLGGFATGSTKPKDKSELKEGEKPKRIHTTAIKLSLPIKYSKRHHGVMSDYCGKYVSHLVCLEGSGKVRIILSKKGNREVYTEGEVALGADLNIKHNMFSTSHGDEFDYNRDIISGFTNFLKHLDRVKSLKRSAGLEKKEVNKLSSKNKRDLESWQLKLLNDVRHKCSLLLTKMILNGYNHIILEDLIHISSGYTQSEEFEGIKYTRLWSMLHVGGIKQIIKQLAYKRGISVTFVPASYTSQRCNKCGHISRNNRKTQELFVCECCGHTANADNNASKNIRDIYCVDVLRSSLLNQNLLGEYVPRKLGRNRIKDIYLEHSYQLAKANSEARFH